MNPTDQAKQRAAHLKRPGAKPVSPHERVDAPLEPPGAPPAVQGAAQHNIQMAPGGNLPPGHPLPGQIPGQAPLGERPEPRSQGEVNADLQAYGQALDHYREAQEDAAPEESKKKKKKGDGYSDDDNEFEDSIWGKQDILDNEDRRKRIESRCTPMSLEDYIVNGGVKQTVPIVPGRVEPTFRTAGTDEDLEIKRMMFGMQGTDVYIANRYSLMQLTLSLFAFNGEPLPDHLDKNGDFDEDRFQTKFNKVKKYPTQLAEDLYYNYTWFDERVKKLFDEDLGNG